MGNATKIDGHKLFKQILVSVVVAVLHLLKIHGKMIFGNPAIVVQDMFGITPKSFNAVNVIFAFVGKRFAVVQPVMLAHAFEGVVAPEGVRVVDRSFSRVRLDVGHQFISRHLLNNFGIHPSISLKKAKNNAFAGCSAAAFALSSAAKVRLVNLNLSFQFAALKLGNMVDRLTQALVDASDALVIYAKVSRDAVRRLLLIEPGQYGNLTAQLFQGFLFSTVLFPAFHIPSFGLAHLKRTAENAFSAPQKVGRTIENVLFLHNQAVLYHVLGYESH